jgi:hypothetical protein
LPLSIVRIYDNLRNFDFATLFTKELGWSLPVSKRPIHIDTAHTRYEIARLADVPAFEVRAIDGKIPPATVRDALYKEISSLFHKKLLIFIDENRLQSLWYWIKHKDNQCYKREYMYIKGQSEDLFLSKLDEMTADLGMEEEMAEAVGLVDHLRKPVTKEFYTEYDEQRRQFFTHISGIDDVDERHWYTSVLLNRLIFIYFLQQRGFLDNGNLNYLQDKLTMSQERGADHFYDRFLQTLFFEGFAKPPESRSADVNALLGKIVYLNGGLFAPHVVETRWPNIRIPDLAFKNLLLFFSSYVWSLVDIPTGRDEEINPDVLGYLFEVQMDHMPFGSAYIRTEITEYFCKQTIYRILLEKVNRQIAHGNIRKQGFDSIEEMLANLDSYLCQVLLFDILPYFSLLDPTCGPGTFLVAALKTLSNIYSAVIGKIGYLRDSGLTDWLSRTTQSHPNMNYYCKKRIITNNLFGIFQKKQLKLLV